MSAGLWVAVGAIGGAGALARFLLDAAIAERVGREFPWGTFAINITGTFLLGLCTGAGLTGTTLLLAGTAALGSYTTFSTWLFESHHLGRHFMNTWSDLLIICASASPRRRASDDHRLNS